MTIRNTPLLLCAGVAVIAGCSGGGGVVDGGGGGGDAGGDLGGPVTICLDGQPCGADGAPAATCGKVPPCGGDVVGDWRFEEVCHSAASIAMMKSNFATIAQGSFCVGQTLVAVAPEATGSLTFDAAGTYELALTYGGYLDVNYPASCLAGLSCDDATAGFQSQIDDGTFPLRSATSISCAGTSSCLCRTTVNSPRAETGMYAISGSVLSFGGGLDKSYCVAGNQLHILDTTLRSTGQTEIDTDLIATKSATGLP
jgi:hypothetical protein